MSRITYAPDLTAAQRAAIAASNARLKAARAADEARRAALTPEARAQEDQQRAAFFDRMQSEVPKSHAHQPH